VAEGQHTRRPDVLLFVNGLPLAVIELKNPADEDATVEAAFGQLQTYQAEIPTLFNSNVALVASDGRSNWFKGVQLLAVYAMLAAVCYMVPVAAP
jgi:type I site-specific restriction-modification system R (restriction) subunit